jgi:trimeric autotransporter adhesin
VSDAADSVRSSLSYASAAAPIAAAPAALAAQHRSASLDDESAHYSGDFDSSGSAQQQSQQQQQQSQQQQQLRRSLEESAEARAVRMASMQAELTQIQQNLAKAAVTRQQLEQHAQERAKEAALAAELRAAQAEFAQDLAKNAALRRGATDENSASSLIEGTEVLAPIAAAPAAARVTAVALPVLAVTAAPAAAAAAAAATPAAAVAAALSSSLLLDQQLQRGASSPHRSFLESAGYTAVEQAEAGSLADWLAAEQPAVNISSSSIDDDSFCSESGVPIDVQEALLLAQSRRGDAAQQGVASTSAYTAASIQRQVRAVVMPMHLINAACYSEAGYYAVSCLC